MYHGAGNFGQVRVAGLVPTLRSKDRFSLNSVGWHRCNDLYQITRPQGCEFPLLLITTGGCGAMSIQGTSLSLPPGSLAFIPRNIPNSYRTPEGECGSFTGRTPAAPPRRPSWTPLPSGRFIFAASLPGIPMSSAWKSSSSSVPKAAPSAYPRASASCCILPPWTFWAKKGPCPCPFGPRRILRRIFMSPCPSQSLRESCLFRQPILSESLSRSTAARPSSIRASSL